MNPLWNEIPELQEIAARLRRIHRRWLLLSAGRVALSLIGVALGVFWILTGIEHWWGLSVTTRYGIWTGVAVLLAGAAGIFIYRWLGAVPLRRRALELEAYAPELREQLITAVEMADGEELKRLGYSPILYNHSVRVAREKLNTLDLGHFWKRAGLVRGLRYLVSGAALTLILAVAFPSSAGRTLFALANPSMEIARPVPFTWTAEPGNAKVMQYEDITLTATASGPKPPSEARLRWQYLDGEEWFSEPLEAEDGATEHRFTHVLSALPQSIRYLFEADGRRSAEYQIVVARRPELTNITAVCAPPAYTGIKEFGLTSGQDKWIVPDGSEIRLSVSSDRNLESGYLAFTDSSRTPLEVDGDHGEARWRIHGHQMVRVFVADTSGLTNHDPVPIEIEVIPDLAPQVAFLVPGADRDIPETMTIPMALALLDDYGFSKVEMIFKTVGQEGESVEKTQTLSLPNNFGKEGVFEFNWSLLDARLFPGDRVLYRARAYDNGHPKPKWTETETYALRLPTLDEIIAETEHRQQERTDEVAKAVLQQQKMAEELREMARQLAGKDKVEWENKQQLEQAMATQQQLAEQMQKWADDLEKEADQLAQNRMTSLEVLQKMNEIARLLKEVMTPEMEAALEKLRKAMEAMTPEEMRKALEEYQMNEEELMAQLDRALEQLKQMQLEQMMENMLRTAEKLAEKQQEQNRATEQDPDSHQRDSLARQEEGLRDELSELQKKAQELAEKNSAFKNQPEIEEFAQAVQQCEAGANMDAMSQQLQQGQTGDAKKSGKKAAEQMRGMLGKMQQQMLEMQNRMNAEQMDKLRELASRTLEMSDEQESMGDSTSDLSDRSPGLRDLAAKQAAVSKGIQQLLQEFDAQSKENLFLKPEIRQLLKASQENSDQATGSMLDQNGVKAETFQYESMFSLNEAAKGMMESLDNQSQCQGQSPGQGKLHEGMQQLSQQQMQLNQQTQSMANPFGLSPGEQNAVKRLSAQQQSIQERMRDLGEQYEQSRDRLGRLDELANSMDEVIEDLGSGDIADATLERQRNIYNRMLDFQKSLQRQDYENRRQSRSGKELQHSAPDALSAEELGRQDEAARWERFKNEWYPQRFRALVKDYFETVSRGAGGTK